MRTATRARTSAIAVLVAGALALTACGGGDEPAVGSSGGDSGSSAGAVEANDQDVDFLQGMVPHHAQAVEMAEIVLAKDPSEPVRSLAERIKAAQDPEIEQMNGMLAEIGEKPAGDTHGGHGGSTHGGHGGMMSEAELQELESATGADAERLFLQLMVEHHQGAIDAADEQIADGEHSPAIALARQIREAQQAEIDEMEQLLSQL